MAIHSINPVDGQVLASYDEMSSREVREVVERAHRAFIHWERTSFDERATLLKALAARLRAEVEDHARMMTLEMGKPIAQARAEVEKCAWVCDYYAEHGARFLADEAVATDARRSYVAHRPLGVVLAIMPWNFPYWQVFRFLAPALMAGNGAVLKHASNVFGSALAIEGVVREAGFPEDLFRTLRIGSARVDETLALPWIRAATLTGSEPAGRAVAQRAGALLKKTVLELGGSDPYLILEDADLGLAVESCVTSRLINGGQSCIAAKRFIVVEAVREAFEARYVETMKARRMGDPLDADTDLGPQAREDLRDDLHRQVEESVARGARRLLGGEVPDRPGAWYPATVLSDVAAGMPAYDEETFGPVAAIIPVRDEDEAVRVANDSSFGLGAAVFTRDEARGEHIARDRLQAGSCFVNAFVRSDPRLPFGGIKDSGYGRELSHHGIREFVNVKTVYLG